MPKVFINLGLRPETRLVDLLVAAKLLVAVKLLLAHA
jgi:hypothetical protein